jgi:hypothetical protein
MTRRVLAFALLVAAPIPSAAQERSAADVMTLAIAAYQNLDFDLAATLLQRALAGDLSDSTRVRALTYLGAAEHYRVRDDSAVAVFTRLVVLAPRYRPDTLVFPPEITRIYDDVRSRTKVEAPQLAVAPPPPAPASAAPVAAAAQPPPPPAPLPARSSVADTSDLLRTHTRITASGGGMVANVRAHSEAGLPSASGTVLGMTASARMGRFELGVHYLEGSLETRDLVEGAAALQFVTTPWLTLHAGPLIRRYDMPAGAERWTLWQLGARAEAPIAGTVRGHALLWQGLGLSVNVPPGSGTAQGGEFGVTYDMPSRPFWFALAYSIDHASLESSSRRETVAMLTVTAGVRR